MVADRGIGLPVKRLEVPSGLGEMAYEALKESLLRMDLTSIPEEERLDERELARRLGVSRTPLREAINRLVAEGFLKVVPRKGVFIVRKSKREMVEILLVRAALEGMAARLAVDHVTDRDIQQMRKLFSPFDQQNVQSQFVKYSDANVKFHEMVLQISQCGKLIELASHVFDHMQWIRRRTAVFAERLGKSLKEHLQIIDALDKRNAELAEKRMRKHIEDLARYVEEKIEVLP